MLDDLNYIARFDSQNILALAAGLPEQLNYDAYQFAAPPIAKLANIVITGMGGSALAGLLIRSWQADQLKVPVVVTRDYELPGFVDSRTLVIASSYSGNTEETLQAAEQALSNKAVLIVVSAGGKLAELAQAQKVPYLPLPADLPPRMAAWAELRVLAMIFDELGITVQAVKDLTAALPFLLAQANRYLPQVKAAENPAKLLAQQLAGKSVVVYGGPVLAAAAYKWKISFNENAKNLAFSNEIPELNHNEMIGWTSHPMEKPFAVIELESSFDTVRAQERFTFTNRVLSGQMPAPIEVKAEGKTKIEQILSTVLLGEFASIYLAILNGVNPLPVDLVEQFKTKLG
ncbi:bifunctional phosphoglucose/phosphomannose isomerase [Candidatus Microgenomates bacterium]|nr:bifunctional phosphoglucose/phosphomannose isomerase [Candidatus Microgenomates bacterium]